MRKTLIACAAALATLASIELGSAAPFCLASDQTDGPPGCTYQTWAQCRASVTGVGLFCYMNTASGYRFDIRDPANPRVIGLNPRPHFRARH